jgi:hypothetical protein
VHSSASLFLGELLMHRVLEISTLTKIVDEE